MLAFESLVLETLMVETSFLSIITFFLRHMHLCLFLQPTLLSSLIKYSSKASTAFVSLVYGCSLLGTLEAVGQVMHPAIILPGMSARIVILTRSTTFTIMQTRAGSLRNQRNLMDSLKSELPAKDFSSRRIIQGFLLSNSR